MPTFLLHSGEQDARMLSERLQTRSGRAIPADWTGKMVIHWGAYQRELPGMPVLQPIKSILRAQHKRKRDETLRLHGLKTEAYYTDKRELSYYPYKYKIPVFHLRPLTVYEKKESLWMSATSRGIKGISPFSEPDKKNIGYQEASSSQLTFHMKRAMREAVKAIYALGLDYGIVTLGVSSTGNTLVLEVDPVPKLNSRLCELFARAIERYDAELASELTRSERVMLGSDPEFLLLSQQGKVVSASRFLEREGAVGCDAIVLSGHRVILPLAELRPQPSVDPRQLARNLHLTMQLAARLVPDESLAWLSGGMPLRGFPLGGHVHFSRCWLNSHLLRALDTYLALPLMQIEGDTTRLRRPRYGFLGDFRRQSHGGFEYRTLPSWLASPDITLGVFALASLIADHYWLLPSKPLAEHDTQAFYYRGEKNKLHKTVKQLWEDLEQLESYAVYAPMLKPLRLQVLNMEPWNEMADFRRTWKIAPYQRKEDSLPQFMV
jgi:hypothetical protein